jgi:hypothetical protein
MLREVHKRRLGKFVQKVPMHMVDDGINSVRQLLPFCQFDEGPTAEGVKCLKNYRKEWDDERGVCVTARAMTAPRTVLTPSGALR